MTPLEAAIAANDAAIADRLHHRALAWASGTDYQMICADLPPSMEADKEGKDE